MDVVLVFSIWNFMFCITVLESFYLIAFMWMQGLCIYVLSRLQLLY